MSNPEWKQVEQPAEGADIFHYTSCGLDNVYLVGGFKRHNTRYGSGVSIANVEGLHKAIGETMVNKKENLCGPEIRFLRKEMKLTQEELATYLHVDPQSVARWEKGQHDIQGPADIVVRALYKGYVGALANVKKISEAMDQTGAHTAPKELVFKAAA
jgi:putative transcriptional regulator